MKSKVFIFTLGAIVGAAIAAGVLFTRSVKPGATETETAASTASAGNVAELESELASLKDRLKKAEQQNDLLAARVQSLNQQAITPTPAPAEPKKRTGFAAMFGGDGTNGMSEAMTEMMKTAAMQQSDAKLAAMTAKQKLTPEQEAAIREIMAKQATRGMDIAQKMLKDGLSEEDMKEFGKSMPNEEEQIKALLTPEQMADYDQFEAEERTRMARLSANAELMQLQTTLRLTEEQQDKVFAVLADQAQSTGKNTPQAAMDFRGQAERKAESLRAILTPEQFERYQKFQEQQLKMIEAFMPKKSSDTGNHVTPVAN